MNPKDKPSIKAFVDGPLVVNGLEKCANKNGPVETKAKMVLCRCGQSANKPFCDGTHSKIGFTSAKESPRNKDQHDHYRGKNITIHDNRSICAHAGYCTDQLAEVFRIRLEPWVDPDADSLAAIIATIKQCPSGALSYSVEGSEADSGGQQASVFIAPNGPYVVSGNIDFDDAGWAEGANKASFTLCRCGASKNKPFCDGSHWDIKFSDDKN